MVANDVQSGTLQQRDVAQDLRPDPGMPADELVLLGRQRARLQQDVVRNTDLADVVQQEPVLEARIVEQRGRSDLGELERVAAHAVRACRLVAGSRTSTASASAVAVCRYASWRS